MEPNQVEQKPEEPGEEPASSTSTEAPPQSPGLETPRGITGDHHSGPSLVSTLSRPSLTTPHATGPPAET